MARLIKGKNIQIPTDEAASPVAGEGRPSDPPLEPTGPTDPIDKPKDTTEGDAPKPTPPSEGGAPSSNPNTPETEGAIPDIGGRKPKMGTHPHLQVVMVSQALRLMV